MKAQKARMKQMKAHKAKMKRMPTRAKNPKMTRGPGQLNLLCKNANFKGRSGNLWGGPHRPAPKKAK